MLEWFAWWGISVRPLPTFGVSKVFPAIQQRPLPPPVSVTLANGDPKLRAQSRVTLTGFRTGVDEECLATTVTHKLASGGYTTSLEAENPSD